MKGLGILVILIAVAFINCKRQPANITIAYNNVTLDSSMESYADTIVNDMVVKNPDASDTWTESWLRQFKRKEIIEAIFNDVYKQKLLAYDYYTGKELSLDEVKKLEKTEGYNRENIGKFQFKEAWYYDKEKHIFIKKVYSIIFGFEIYDETGFVKGYKPLFMVKL